MSHPLPRVAVVTPLFPPGLRGGGPVRTLGAMVERAPAWADVHVFTRSRDHGADQDMVDVVNRPVPFHDAVVTYAQTHRAAGWASLIAGLRRVEPSLLYLNSYWSLPFSQLVLALRRLRLLPVSEVVLAPRGELAEGALTRHPGRKRLMRRLNTLLGTHADLTWHASSEREAADIRSFAGPDSRIVIRENDTTLPHAPLEPAETSEAGRLRVVFVGRLVEHKGALIAAKAARLAGSGVELDVFGPEEDADYVQALRRLESESAGQIRLRGMLATDDVRDTVSGYDVMIMPTRSENFGHVIAEALSASVPLILPDVTPWTGRIDAGGAGVIADRTPQSMAAALTAWAEQTRQEKLGARHRAGQTYRAWRNETSDAPHLFDLLKGRGLLSRQARRVPSVD